MVRVAHRASRRLLVDVTQYVSWPATSGVQRVLWHLTEEWPAANLDASYGFAHRGRYVTGPISKLAAFIASTFQSKTGTEASSESAHDALSAGAVRVAAGDIERFFRAYLLPEPTLSWESLAVAERLLGSRQVIPWFIYYDALPLTHPHLFGPHSDHGLVVTRYHRALARAENIAFISQAVRDGFETRIARRRVPNAIVTRPGANGLRRVEQIAPARPTFVTIGTIEPRKRHRLILETFEQLWAAGRDYRLVILGSAGAEEDELIARLREMSSTSRLTWIEQPNDQVVAEELAGASAMLFLSDGEGYGLPPLEALAVGCPVAVATGLPSLEGLPGGGQIRLETVTVAALASAVETLANPASYAEHRRAIADVPLPTWRQFAHDVADWISSGVGSEERPDQRGIDGASGS